MKEVTDMKALRLIMIISLFFIVGIYGCGGNGNDNQSSSPPLVDSGNGGGGGDAPDTTSPTVLSVNPPNETTGVATNSTVTAIFSEAMNASTINTATFTVTGVTGTVSYAGTTAIFTPDIPLTNNTVYTATITTAVNDLAGNALAENYSWSFTTTTTAITAWKLTDTEAVISAIAINNAGEVYVAGYTTANSNNGFDSFIGKFGADGQQIASVYITRGGGQIDITNGIDIDSAGNVYTLDVFNGDFTSHDTVVSIVDALTGAITKEITIAVKGSGIWAGSDIFVDETNMYFSADYPGYMNAVLKLDLNGNILGIAEVRMADYPMETSITNIGASPAGIFVAQRPGATYIDAPASVSLYGKITGDEIWERNIYPASGSNSLAMKLYADDTGVCVGAGTGVGWNYHYLIFRYDNFGNLLWQNEMLDQGGRINGGVASDSNACYFMSGNAESGNLIKVSKTDGALIWSADVRGINIKVDSINNRIFVVTGTTNTLKVFNATTGEQIQ